MAKQEAMSLQARRARPVVVTGIALATAGILVAVPAIAPPLTARDVQVAENVQTDLSRAQVNLAALSDALAAFQDGGPLGALLAGLLGPDAQAAFQDGGPLGAVLFALGVDADLVAAFQEGGPLGAALFATVGEDARAAFQDGGPLGAALFALGVDPDLVAAFQDGGPVGLVLTALAGDNAAALNIVAGFQEGGPLGAVIAAILGPPPPEPTTLAAQQEAGTAITRVPRVFGRNAERSFVDLSTLSQADEPQGSDLAIEAKPEAPKPRRAALPKPFRAVLPEAPVIEAPVTEVLEETEEGTKGRDEGNRLVRNSPKFRPNTTILPVGSQSGAGAGGWNLFQGIRDAVDGLSGGSLNGPANATDRGAENGDGEG